MTTNTANTILENFKHLYSDLSDNSLILVSVSKQTLYLFEQQALIKTYRISSAKAGIGNLSGSFKTPLGLHKIAQKIGDKAKLGSVFKARKNTKNIAKILDRTNVRSDGDLITSRILWLAGLEEGFNKGIDSQGNNVDSHSRYIYIHGTDEEGRLGQAVSHGCIRMANNDVIELYDKVKPACWVFISEK